MKIAIINYGAGNIQSILFAIERLGYTAVLTNNPYEIQQADKVIFPGVGEASYAMKKLKESGLDSMIPTLKQPVLGICLGMQLAVIEFARSVAGFAQSNSTEFEPNVLHPVVALITEWKNRDGKIEQRSDGSDLGGTMRLGSQRCPVKAGTLASRIYGSEVNERHRHRYEVNNGYVPDLEKAGLIISARTPTEDLPEMMELPESMHPWFFGVQFYPEFTSTPRYGHPLFNAFIEAALIHAGKISPEKAVA